MLTTNVIKINRKCNNLPTVNAIQFNTKCNKLTNRK